MAKVPPVQVGSGWTDLARQRFLAWQSFLLALQRRAPEALRELATLATQPQPPSDGELARWASDWGLPWASYWEAVRPIMLLFGPDEQSAAEELSLKGYALAEPEHESGEEYWRNPPKDFFAARVVMGHVRFHVTLWRKQPDWAGRWQAFSGEGHVYAPWPVLDIKVDDTEANIRKRVKAYIRKLKAFAGITPTSVTYDELDFDALVLEHVLQLSLPEVMTRLPRESRKPDTPREERSTRRRNRQLAAFLGLDLRHRPFGRPKLDKQ
jgi:hypothetical protein